jgi:hypothetical protein
VFQVSITSTWRQAVVAMLLIGAVAFGLAVRDASQPPLGRADDYGTRHAPAVAALELSWADDYATRHLAQPALGRQDDFATRHASGATLTEADDYGTRHGR